METLRFWTTDYGQTIRCRSYEDDIDNASVALVMKNVESGTKATITGAVVPNDTDEQGEACNSVDVVITEDFLEEKAGTWVAQLSATWQDGHQDSKDSFYIKVAVKPTA